MRIKSLFFGFLFGIIVAVISSCASTKSSTSHSEGHESDSTAITTIVHGGVGQTSFNVDSLFRLWVVRDSLHQSTSETSTEHITETITSYIDSLGREVRQEQRTIDRNEARQQELRFQQWQQQQEQRIASEYARIDSLYAMFQQMQSAHQSDSISHLDQKEPVETLTWWGRVEQWIGRRAIILIITVIIMFVIWHYAKPIHAFLSKFIKK